MRTIDFIKSEEKRVRIAKESLSIYAPLAARIGMYKIRDELQDLSFAQIYPEARNYIVEKLLELRESKKDLIDKIIIELKADENMDKIKCNILKPFINYIIQLIYPYLIISTITD